MKPENLYCPCGGSFSDPNAGGELTIFNDLLVIGSQRKRARMLAKCIRATGEFRRWDAINLLRETLHQQGLSTSDPVVVAVVNGSYGPVTILATGADRTLIQYLSRHRSAIALVSAIALRFPRLEYLHEWDEPGSAHGQAQIVAGRVESVVWKYEGQRHWLFPTLAGDRRGK